MGEPGTAAGRLCRAETAGPGYVWRQRPAAGIDGRGEAQRQPGGRSFKAGGDPACRPFLHGPRGRNGRDGGVVPERYPEIAGVQASSRVITSRYFSLVLATISSGSTGPGACLFQPLPSSLSRTNCLSKLGGLLPGRYWSAGQKRDESGVSASSIHTRLPASSSPNSNLVSAIMFPRVSAYSAADLYRARLASRTWVARSWPIRVAICSNVMFSSCAPSAALVEGVKMGSGRRPACTSPAGSGMPQTDWLAWYSFQPEPAR